MAMNKARALAHWFVMLVASLFAVSAPLAARAGTLAKADLDKIFAPKLVVGEQNAGLPVRPLFAREGAKLQLQGYVFESIDFEPVRGYAGKPINMLVAIDPAGRFLDVRVLDHHEPLFRSAAGTALLSEFAQQYKGLTVNHSIEIFGPKSPGGRDETSARLHGVAAGTVTVKAMDLSIMESAMSVARAHLDAAETGASKLVDQGNSPGRSARQVERHTTMFWSELVDKRLVQSIRLTRGQIEQAFAGTRAAGSDKLAANAPNDAAVEFQVALVSIPQIGRNLLDQAGWRQLSANLRRASQALLVTEQGPLTGMAYESQRAQVAVPFVLSQGGRELGLRLMAYDKGLNVPGYPQELKAHFLLIDSATPLDAAAPFDLSFRLTRRYGQFSGQLAQADFPLRYKLPDAAHWIASSYESPWVAAWRQRSTEIGILCLGLLVLTIALSRQKWLSATQGRLQGFRVGYLLFTLGFIGWYAQGQLTIVNMTASLESLAAGRDLRFLLADPVTVILWGFVAVTLLVWGRGTFCGWLCPFGALQELTSLVAQRLGLRPKRLRTALDARLKWVKYAVLATVILTVFIAPPLAESAVEVEPFKTAISSYFQRDWPYVVWALACLALGVMVYRGYCRYICPLGAALAATDVLRRWAWIPRREQCGTPCQSCRHRCAYQAIAPAGEIEYSECFQCLDCVAIHQDVQRCLPLIQQRREVQHVIRLRRGATS